MPDTDFTVADAVNAEPPVFVRKVDRQGHWNTETQADIVENVFPVESDGTVSIWRIETFDDLQRIAIALNARRVKTNPKGASLTENLFLLAIRPNEFGTITLDQSDGETDCLHAKERHYDAHIDDPQQLQALVNSLLSSGRQLGKLTKGKLKQLVERATADRCRAVVTESTLCKCESA
ncbi:MAG: hypothetical protein WD648_12950 [Planctomycetaceae bacterium]